MGVFFFLSDLPSQCDPLIMDLKPQLVEGNLRRTPIIFSVSTTTSRSSSGPRRADGGRGSGTASGSGSNDSSSSSSRKEGSEI